MCKKFILLVFVMAVTVGTANAAGNLVGSYQFEDNYNDTSGYGTAANATFQGGMEGINGGITNDPVHGLVFWSDGAAYLDCGADAAIGSKYDFTTGTTIALWANVSSAKAGTWSTMVGKGVSTGYFLMKENNDNDYGGFPATSDGGGYAGGGKVKMDEWHHYAVTFGEVYAGNTMVRSYIDGVMSAGQGWKALGATITPNDLNLLIGGLPEWGGLCRFAGMLDDVRLYDYAMTEDQVKALVPEPATLVLLGLGGLFLRRRK